MHPILFKIGPFTAYSYSVFLSLGFVVFIIYSKVEAKNKRIYHENLHSFFLYLFLFGFVFASRAISIILINPKTIFTNPLELIQFWKTGQRSLAFGIVLIVMCFFYTKKTKTQFWKFIDVFIQGLCLFGAIGKTGCLMAGCCYGKTTDAFWGITLHGAKRHPVQIYESVLYVFIFMLIILFLKKKVSYDGQLFLISYGIIYPIIMIFLEFFRADSPIAFNIIPTRQLYAISGIAVASLCIYLLRPGNKNAFIEKVKN